MFQPMNGHLEVLDLRDPLEVPEQSEQHEDVEQREMVGDHHVGGARPDLVPPSSVTGQTGLNQV
jgi:hypothetical protein